MEKDDKREINVELLMEHAEKLMQDPKLGKVPRISQLIEEIKIGDSIYQLRLELKLKTKEDSSDEIII